jgi:hypothetical protein
MFYHFTGTKLKLILKNMSGGKFEYKQYHILEIARDIESVLLRQGKPLSRSERWMDEDYYRKYPEEQFHTTYSAEVQEKMKEAVTTIKKAYIYAQRVDWFLSGDDDAGDLIIRLDEDLNLLETKNYVL